MAHARPSAPSTRRFPILPVHLERHRRSASPSSWWRSSCPGSRTSNIVAGRSGTHRHRRAPHPSTRRSRDSPPSVATRAGRYYGEGPVPLDPVIGWRVPVGADVLRVLRGDRAERMVRDGLDRPAQRARAARTARSRSVRAPTTACTTSSTGLTGLPVRPPLPTRDLAKGSATSDPDGFPLYYAGSRDGRFRIVATDRKEPLVLWSVQGATSVDRPLRNDDWDAPRS